MKRCKTILLATLLFVAPAPKPASAWGLEQRCIKYEPLMVRYAPKDGWNVRRMSYYMWRESRCTPTVRSRTRDSGLLQINDVNLPWLSSKLHRRITPAALMDPITNVQAAARLCEYGRKAWGNCYQPWGS